MSSIETRGTFPKWQNQKCYHSSFWHILPSLYDSYLIRVLPNSKTTRRNVFEKHRSKRKDITALCGASRPPPQPRCSLAQFSSPSRPGPPPEIDHPYHIISLNQALLLIMTKSIFFTGLKNGKMCFQQYQLAPCIVQCIKKRIITMMITMKSMTIMITM